MTDIDDEESRNGLAQGDRTGLHHGAQMPEFAPMEQVVVSGLWSSDRSARPSQHMSTYRANESVNAGTLAHEGIGRLLLAGGSPSMSEIDQVVRDLMPDYRKDINFRSFRLRVGSGIRAYMWRFALDQPWRLIGREVQVGTGRVDILWWNGTEYLIDEIKTGLITQMTLQGAASQQTDRYAADGLAAYGTAFLGVRCLPLLDPRSAELKVAPGVSKPLPTRLRRQKDA